jgi:hypothetical protein
MRGSCSVRRAPWKHHTRPIGFPLASIICICWNARGLRWNRLGILVRLKFTPSQASPSTPWSLHQHRTLRGRNEGFNAPRSFSLSLLHLCRERAGPTAVQGAGQWHTSCYYRYDNLDSYSKLTLPRVVKLRRLG